MSSDSVTTSSERYTGRVKWFNNKTGYGFITVTDGPRAESDVFVHHSSINVDSEQYKYLVQGEYVEFKLLETNTPNHEFQAGEVCGVGGGKLMCETRHDTRVARFHHKSSTDRSSVSNGPRQARVPREPHHPKPRGRGPREGEWVYVAKSRPDGTQTQRRSSSTTSTQSTTERNAGKSYRKRQDRE